MGRIIKTIRMAATSKPPKFSPYSNSFIFYQQYIIKMYVGFDIIIIYIRQMWGKSILTQSQTNQPKTNFRTRNHSKVLNVLLNSDSEEDDDYLSDIQEVKPIEKTYKKDIPPLLFVSKAETLKENVSYESNKPAKEIKYACYKLQGQKLVEIQAPNQYNSLNLEQASIIRDNTQILLLQEIEKLKTQLMNEKNTLNSKIKELESQNRTLQRELTLTKDQLKTKQICFDEEVERLEKKIKQLQNEQLEKKQEAKEKISEIKREKRQGQLSRFLSGANKQIQQSVLKKGEDSIQAIYQDITVYLKDRVAELKNKLLVLKMSGQVEDVIEEFMTEVVNINPIIVGRVVAKTKNECIPTPVRSLFRTQPDENISILSKSSIFRESQQTQGVMPVKTPPKQLKRDLNQKQSQQSLRNLQKSLTKLKEMERQYASRTPNIPKDSFSSLDRSSFMGLDKSNRSKSRRKKIFQ